MKHSEYLARIGYEGPLAPSLATLRALQEAHLLHVPFENLDIWAGKRIELADSYDKIVRAGRGGFCYELNGLFAELLRGLGFAVQLVSARVFDPRHGFGPEFDHLALVVAFREARYLADVGFGEFTRAPLKLEVGPEQLDPHGRFVILRHDETHLVVNKLTDSGAVPQYIFTETERRLSDFLPMCRYHQTSPASHFTQGRICSVLTPTGRVTISNNRLLVREGAEVTETLLGTEEAFCEALRQYFHIIW